MFRTVGHDLTSISPGLYILFVLGPAQNLTNFIIQCLGIAASLLSVVKGVAEYHLFTRFNEIKVFMEKEFNFILLIKSFLFHLPHIVFRSFSISAIAAFAGYYALIPFSTMCIINTTLTFACSHRSSRRQIISLLTSFLAPSVFNPIASYDRALLKRSTLVNTLILLLSIITIAILPIINNESALLATPGLCHINFNQTMVQSNPACDKDTNTTLGENMTIFESNITIIYKLTATYTGLTLQSPFLIN